MTGFPGGLAAVAASLGAACAVLSACSGSSSGTAGRTPCSSSALECPSGTTCWPATASADLECLPSLDSGTFGVACAQQVDRATCASGLGCDQQSGDGGVCTYYCGPTGTECPAGYDCRTTHVGGASGPAVNVCRATADSGASGGDGSVLDASAADATGDALVAYFIDAAVAGETGPSQQVARFGDAPGGRRSGVAAVGRRPGR